MLKNIRILILLYLLLMVAVAGWLARERTTAWERPLNVVVYAINGDGGAVSQGYIEALEGVDFADIEAFFGREARRYGLALKQPVRIAFAGALDSRPPAPPRADSTLSIMWWSLKLRYWAWRHDEYPYPQDIVIFVQYFDPAQNPVMADSLGLQKGLIGIVNAFASKAMQAQNNVIIAHEMLHTVGATDKYAPATNQPLYPIGYASPEQRPLFPQQQAEIMAGRIPISESQARQPEGLRQVILGEATALEINWPAAGR